MSVPAEGLAAVECLLEASWAEVRAVGPDPPIRLSDAHEGNGLELPKVALFLSDELAVGVLDREAPCSGACRSAGVSSPVKPTKIFFGSGNAPWEGELEALHLGGLGGVKLADDDSATRKFFDLFAEHEGEVVAVPLARVAAQDDAVASVFFSSEILADSFKLLFLDVARLDLFDNDRVWTAFRE